MRKSCYDREGHDGTFQKLVTMTGDMMTVVLGIG